MLNQKEQLYGMSYEMVQVQGGLFNVRLGSIKQFPADLFFGDRYLEIRVGGETLLPRQKIGSVPFAITVRGIKVDESGKVGIGTTTPLKNLRVEGTSILLRNTTPGSALNLRTASNGDAFLNNMDSFVGNGSTGNKLLLLTGQTGIAFRYGSSGTSGTDAMRITSSGNFGIGTTSPGAKLDIDGSSTTTAGIIVHSTQNLKGIRILDIHNSTNMFRMGLHYNNPDPGLDIVNRNNSSLFHITETNGNVGIGTTSPTYRLGLPNIPSTAGRGRANAWVTYSSRRGKENIKPIPKALDKVQRLRGVSFHWKANGKHDIGLIAEEVGEVLQCCGSLAVSRRLLLVKSSAMPAICRRK